MNLTPKFAVRSYFRAKFADEFEWMFGSWTCVGGECARRKNVWSKYKNKSPTCCSCRCGAMGVAWCGWCGDLVLAATQASANVSIAL